MESKAQPFVQKTDRGLDSFRRSMRRSVRRGRGKGALSAVLRGTLVAASVTVIAIAAFAIALSWWNASDRVITAINQVVKFVSILAGVVTALSGFSGSGTMRGIAVGALYMALGALCHSLLMGRGLDAAGYWVDLGMGVASGGLFGMILTGRKGT